MRSSHRAAFGDSHRPGPQHPSLRWADRHCVGNETNAGDVGDGIRRCWHLARQQSLERSALRVPAGDVLLRRQHVYARGTARGSERRPGRPASKRELQSLHPSVRVATGNGLSTRASLHTLRRLGAAYRRAGMAWWCGRPGAPAGLATLAGRQHGLARHYGVDVAGRRRDLSALETCAISRTPQDRAVRAGARGGRPSILDAWTDTHARACLRRVAAGRASR